MKEHMQAYNLRHEEMGKQLGLMVVRVDGIERSLCNPMDGTLNTTPLKVGR